MSTPVPLPALGESVTEGTVSRWLKQVGDRVEMDEPLVEVSTDKVDTEIPSPAAGVLLEIKVAEDDTCPVGGVLGVIGDESEAPAEAAPTQPEPAEEPAAPAEQQQVPAEEVEAAAEQTEAEQPAPQAAAAPAPSSGGAGTEVLLPQLGESVTEGTISRWLKQVGDTVEADEALVEVSTDKVDTEIPSPAAGVLLEIKVAEDQVAPVGAVLAIVGEPGSAPAAAEPEPEPEPEAAPEPEPAPQAAPSAPPAAPPAAPAPQPAPQSAPAPQAAPAAEAQPRRAADQPSEDVGYVTPLVRKLATQHGVDLGSVTGTGVGGRIRKQDVISAAEAAKAQAEADAKAAAEAAAAPPAPSAAPAAAPAAPAAPAAAAAPSGPSKRGTTEKMTRLRATIAKRMVESLQVSAQLTATVEVDFTAISKLRARAKDDFRAREGVGLSYLPFICKAVCEGLKQFEKINATIDTEAGTISYADGVHLGIAVDTEKGLLVPVVRDAGDLGLAGLAKKIGDLAARTRASKVAPDELAGGTFTVTNYGSAGTLMDTPIINQPQVAILGTGALVKRPMVISEKALGDIIAIRDIMYLSMSYDHRLVDGADAARFLSFVKARLEAGDFAAELGL